MLLMSLLTVCFQSVTEEGKPPWFQKFGKLSTKPAFQCRGRTQREEEIKLMYVV